MASPSTPPLSQQTEPECRDQFEAFLFVCLGLVIIYFSLLNLTSSSSPQFQVLSVTTPTPFTLTTATNSTATVTAGFLITFLVDNPKYGTLYGPAANVSVFYHHHPRPDDPVKAVAEYYLNSSSFDSFRLDDNQSWVRVTVVASSVPVSDDLIVFLMNQDLNRRGEIGITVKFSADFWVDEDHQAELRVICKDVKIGVPSGVMISQPSQCKVSMHAWERLKQ